MLYFFYGNDIEKARARAKAVISVMMNKRPNAEFYRMTSDNFDFDIFENLIEGQGLFERKNIIFADGLFEKAEIKDWIIERLAHLQDSDSAFVFLEKKAEQAVVNKFKKHAQECKQFDSGSEKIVRDFNTFSLADSLGRRDKNSLWSLYVKATTDGISAEEINGVLFWQVKSMLAAVNSKSASESGLKPFVYSKARAFSASFQKSELVEMSRKLITIYHEGHRGQRDISVSLESFVLSI